MLDRHRLMSRRIGLGPDCSRDAIAPDRIVRFDNCIGRGDLEVAADSEAGGDADSLRILEAGGNADADPTALGPDQLIGVVTYQLECPVVKLPAPEILVKFGNQTSAVGRRRRPGLIPLAGLGLPEERGRSERDDRQQRDAQPAQTTPGAPNRPDSADPNHQPRRADEIRQLTLGSVIDPSPSLELTCHRSLSILVEHIITRNRPSVMSMHPNNIRPAAQYRSP